jgi:hypothetical protein
MLKLELDLPDVERAAAKAGYDVELTVDADGRLHVEARGLKVLGLGGITARAQVGPLSCDAARGTCSCVAEIIDVAGLKLGKRMIAKKLLGLLKKRAPPEIEIDVDTGLVVANTDRLVARFAPRLAGYRVVEAAFIAPSKAPSLKIVVADSGAPRRVKS